MNKKYPLSCHGSMIYDRGSNITFTFSIKSTEKIAQVYGN